MNQKELITYTKGIYDRGIKIMEKKNSDYADPTFDAFANFRFAALAKVSPERAILVRICDKLARISNLIDKKTILVTDETIEDTIIDASNYLAILGAMLVKDKKK